MFRVELLQVCVFTAAEKLYALIGERFEKPVSTRPGRLMSGAVIARGKPRRPARHVKYNASCPGRSSSSKSRTVNFLSAMIILYTYIDKSARFKSGGE